MNKFLALAASFVLGSALLLSGCGSDGANNSANKDGKTTIVVGASPVPHGEILNEAKAELAKEGIDLQVKEFTDYVQPNLALNDKELDANFFQHVPYLEKFNAERGLNLVSAGAVHIEPMGIYSHTLKDLNSIPEGAKVGIPNDPTNGGRALLLLAKQNLLTLKDPTDIHATVADITANPHNLQIVELEAPQLPRSLDDLALAVINTNYAIEAGLNPTKDALAIESADSPYANIVAVRKGDEQRPEIQKLMKALHTAEMKKFITEKYNGAIIPAF